MSSKGTTLGTGFSSKGTFVIGAFSLVFCEDSHSLGYPDVGGSPGFSNASLFLGGYDDGSCYCNRRQG